MKFRNPIPYAKRHRCLALLHAFWHIAIRWERPTVYVGTIEEADDDCQRSSTMGHAVWERRTHTIRACSLRDATEPEIIREYPMHKITHAF